MRHILEGEAEISPWLFFVLCRGLLDDGDCGSIAGDGKVPELPVWHLAAKSSLCRRNIYNDIR
jgi:hypothetical protein